MQHALFTALFLVLASACSDDSAPAKTDSTPLPKDRGPDSVAMDLGALDKKLAPDGTLALDGKPSADSTGAFTLTSSSYSHNQVIPSKHTCDGSDLSPPLSISGAPAGTQYFTLVMTDPDAPSGTFTHWVLYDVKATTLTLAEGIAQQATVTGIGLHALNDFSKAYYRGPCPPKGALHHYHLTLYAHKSALGLTAGGAHSLVTQALTPQIVLGKTVLTGTYQR